MIALFVIPRVTIMKFMTYPFWCSKVLHAVLWITSQRMRSTWFTTLPPRKEIPNTAVRPDPLTVNICTSYPHLLLFAHHVLMNTLAGDRGKMTSVPLLASLLCLKPRLLLSAPDETFVSLFLPTRRARDNAKGSTVGSIVFADRPWSCCWTIGLF